MKKIAYLKSPNTPSTLAKTGFLDEHQLLCPLFQARGFELVALDWQNGAVRWQDYEFIIPKNMWDYHSHYEKFLNWSASMRPLGVEFRNAQELLLWNTDKKYLIDMLERGAAVAPLVSVDREEKFFLIEELFEVASKILLKPAVSGGGKKTGIYGQHEIESAFSDAREILKDCSVIAQPFIEEIAQGEWSFFFFGGAYSHALTKTPKPGDFRAHSLFGAQNLAAHPSTVQIAEARKFLSFLPEVPRYVRVDGVYVQSKLMLIELELIEPYLYFECAPPTAPERFIDALLKE